MKGPTPGQVLHVTSGPASGTSIQVGPEGVILGRSSTGPGGLAGDPHMSRQHAEIRWTTDGELCIRDLGSTNGTVVGGERITAGQWRVLRVGEAIRVGDSVLSVGAPGSGGWTGAIETQPRSRPTSDVHIDGGVHAEGEGVAVGRDFFGGIHTRHEYDASGLGFISRTHGFARFLIIVGTLISLAGVGSIGVTIVKAISANAGDTSAADCRARFPELGPDWNDCMFDATSQKTEFDPGPWIPLGIGLGFAGGIITTVGILSVRGGGNH